MNQHLGTKTEENLSVGDNNNVNSSQASKVSKEHKPARKLQNLSTRISAGTHKRFKQFVLDRHGKINGVYSQEVENALEFYLNSQQQTANLAITSMGNQKTGLRQDVLARHRAIALEFRNLENFPYLNAPTIKSAVSRILGKVDKRTHKTYLQTVRKLSKEEYHNNRFGRSPSFDVTRYMEKFLNDDL